jgi:GNAT superfamily N-acetyltransferase
VGWQDHSVLIRQATAQDREALYRVCLRTADSGADATALWSDPDLVGHNFVGPYLAFEGATTFALVDGDDVVGYSIAAPDTRAFEAFFNEEWAPPLRLAYPLDALAGSRWTADDRWGIHRLHAGLHTAAIVADPYPGQAHIDILPAAQGHGHGRALMEAAIGIVRSSGAIGMHLDVSPTNIRARGFYAHLGFVQGPCIDDLSYLVQAL